MPRSHKKDVLHHKWEYTLLADDFDSFDETARNLIPQAGTMAWRGYQYPDVAYSVIEKIVDEKGPWWIPDEEIWISDDLVLGMLRKAFKLGCVPVIKDTMLRGNVNIEIKQQATIYIPQIPSDLKYDVDRIRLRTAMRKLSISPMENKEVAFFEMVKLLEEYSRQDAFKARLCLIEFPHRIWFEGIYHRRIHPVIVIPTDIYVRYHTNIKK